MAKWLGLADEAASAGLSALAQVRRAAALRWGRQLAGKE
jgi:hypothetical protein